MMNVRQILLQIENEPDDEQKELLFNIGLEQFPNSYELMIDYALFLKNVRKDYDRTDVYFRKALALVPDDVYLNCVYADFLKDIRNNYDQADSYFCQALALAPNNGFLNCVYANFLRNIRKDYRQTAFFYNKALVLDPDNANINGDYANFLFFVCKDVVLAEQYFRKTLVFNPNDAVFNGNFAGFLLALGRKEEAEPHLVIAMQTDMRLDLLLECWFYRLAHFPNYQNQAIHAIEALLNQGVRSVGWDFSFIIERAFLEGYSDVVLLQTIGGRIASTKNC
jgi:Tfp pilus assembly protein PilF